MFDVSAQIQHYVPMLFSNKKYIGVQSHYIDLAINFVTHLIVAIMRHGTYYETPT